MRQVLALTAAATFTAASLTACGGGSADTEEVGARKAACNNAPDFALAAYRPTALPPEPVEELLPKAKFVIEASVARVLYQGEKPERDTEEHVAGEVLGKQKTIKKKAKPKVKPVTKKAKPANPVTAGASFTG